jgi:hypothetical protein
MGGPQDHRHSLAVAALKATRLRNGLVVFFTMGVSTLPVYPRLFGR